MPVHDTVGDHFMDVRKEYEEALAALREAQSYADLLEPRPSEPQDEERGARWVVAKQLVSMLQATVDRLARKLAGSDD